MSRPTFEEIYSQLAGLMSQRSTCARKQVGCVIASADFRQVLGVGYNGSAAGGPNDCDRHGPDAVGSCGCLHAEVNAVINCHAPRGDAKVVFVTCLPCVACAKALINLGGVCKVHFKEDYRVRDSIGWLERAGIEVVKGPGGAVESDEAEDE
jgi:dCMP deaminase